MLRKIQTLPRFLATLFVVAAAIGCDSDQVRKTDDQIVGGVRPTFLFLEVSASRGTITAGEEEKPIKITVRALFADTGEPVGDGTTVNLTTTLGGFDSVGGPAAITLALFDGEGSAQFYPGGTAGTARIRATLQGVFDEIAITVKPFVEPVPPPAASSINVSADRTTANEDDPETEINVEATVLGSDAEPFANAPVQFSSPIGIFTSSGTSSSEILTTDANGLVGDTLTVTDDELLAFAGSTFNITGTLFMEGGATASSSVTINIVQGDEDPVAANVTLQTNVTFVNDDGDPHAVDLTAIVQDQFGALFAGGQVAFSSTLGAPAPATDASDGSGEATSTLSLSASDIENHPTNSFTVTATLTTPTGTDTSSVVINIVREAVATNINLIVVPNSTIDDDGTLQSRTLRATVTDSGAQPVAGVTVTFSTALGTITPGSQTDVTDASGVAEVDLDVTSGQVSNFCSASFLVTASISGASDDATISISRVPLDASFSYVAASNVDVDFTDTTTGAPSSWDWDFDNNGVVDLTVQHPTDVDLSAYGFGSPDSGTVRLTARRGTCTSDVALQTVNTP